jgi:hypothetical protein
MIQIERIKVRVKSLSPNSLPLGRENYKEF